MLLTFKSFDYIRLISTTWESLVNLMCRSEALRRWEDRTASGMPKALQFSFEQLLDSSDFRHTGSRAAFKPSEDGSVVRLQDMWKQKTISLKEYKTRTQWDGLNFHSKKGWQNNRHALSHNFFHLSSLPHRFYRLPREEGLYLLLQCYNKHLQMINLKLLQYPPC